jgi:hypothetical protein
VAADGDPTCQAVRVAAGSRRWRALGGKGLGRTRLLQLGILCLTPSNIESTWLNFEAGALGKVVDEARVVPLLYKLKFTDVARPLGMFMGKPLDEHGIKETLETMNKHLDAESRLDKAALMARSMPRGQD